MVLHFPADRPRRKYEAVNYDAENSGESQANSISSIDIASDLHVSDSDHSTEDSKRSDVMTMPTHSVLCHRCG